MHLYYARFFNHFLHSIGLVPSSEPFKKLLVQGMVMGQSFKNKTNGTYLKEHEVVKKGKKYFTKDGDHPVISTWEKMSKSKHNGVEPENTLSEYGVDTMRLLILSTVAPTSNRNWNSDSKCCLIYYKCVLFNYLMKMLYHSVSWCFKLAKTFMADNSRIFVN